MTTKPKSVFDRKFAPLTTRFDHALLFAAQVHREQERKKSGIPYISHLLGVASIVLDYGGDEDMAIAALLHDAVEDHGGRPMLKVIEQIFGARVAKIVDGCTDSYAEDRAQEGKLGDAQVSLSAADPARRCRHAIRVSGRQAVQRARCAARPAL